LCLLLQRRELVKLENDFIVVVESIASATATTPEKTAKEEIKAVKAKTGLLKWPKRRQMHTFNLARLLQNCSLLKILLLLLQ
jgi:hypothetical protein